MEFYLSKILNFFINPMHILSLVIIIQLFIIFFMQSRKLLKGLYPKHKNKINNNLEKKITSFFDCKKKL